MTRQDGAVLAAADLIDSAHGTEAFARGLLLTLTHQERNVLDLIAQGLTNREIASEMFISEKTVKNYVTRTLCKCNVRNRTEAAIFLLQS